MRLLTLMRLFMPSRTLVLCSGVSEAGDWQRAHRIAYQLNIHPVLAQQLLQRDRPA
jgi:hypothetical protein